MADHIKVSDIMKFMHDLKWILFPYLGHLRSEIVINTLRREIPKLIGESNES